MERLFTLTLRLAVDRRRQHVDRIDEAVMRLARRPRPDQLLEMLEFGRLAARLAEKLPRFLNREAGKMHRLVLAGLEHLVPALAWQHGMLPLKRVHDALQATVIGEEGGDDTQGLVVFSRTSDTASGLWVRIRDEDITVKIQHPSQCDS